MTAPLSDVSVDGSRRCVDLELENAQLRMALVTRVVIEQAKGILSERFGLELEDAFALLRRSARPRRRRHELATEVTTQRETPPSPIPSSRTGGTPTTARTSTGSGK